MLQPPARQLHPPSCGQGMKIVKCGELSTMWDYCKKQKKKIAGLPQLLGKQTTRERTETRMLQDVSLAGYPRRLESVEMDQL